MSSISGEYHLAQVNIARMRAPLDHPIMAEFGARLAEVNALADASPGFVWRLADTSGAAATDIHAFDDDRILINMSVWESIEALWDYTYRSGHAEPLGQRRSWFEPMEGPHLALWWVRAGELPTVADARRKLDLLRDEGPSPAAFTFKERFPAGSDR
jgi:Domain of unknown function (DUF3291)